MRQFSRWSHLRLVMCGKMRHSDVFFSQHPEAEKSGLFRSTLSLNTAATLGQTVQKAHSGGAILQGQSELCNTIAMGFVVDIQQRLDAPDCTRTQLWFGSYEYVYSYELLITDVYIHVSRPGASKEFVAELAMSSGRPGDCGCEVTPACPGRKCPDSMYHRWPSRPGKMRLSEVLI